MGDSRVPLFRGRHFRDEIIILCVRWYLRYPLSYRNLEEMMAERGLTVDHSTIARWVLRYAPVLNERIRSEVRNPNRSWRVDETYVRVAGQWTYLYRAIDSGGNTIEFLLSPYRDVTAAKACLHSLRWHRPATFSLGSSMWTGIQRTRRPWRISKGPVSFGPPLSMSPVTVHEQHP
jgi:transposase-like protein